MDTGVSTFNMSFKPLYATPAQESLSLNGPRGPLWLRDFQKEAADTLQEGRWGLTLLTAPTGSGKTLSLLLGPREKYTMGGVTGLYPNNELVVDQARGVERILVDHLGLRLVHSSAGNFLRSLDLSFFDSPQAPPSIYAVYEGPLETPWGSIERIAVLLASGRTLSRDPPRFTSKLQVLRTSFTRVFESGADYAIVLATPDTLFLNLIGAYGGFDETGRLLAAMLQSEVRVSDLVRQGLHHRFQQTQDVVTNLLCRPLFVDEFHLYDATMTDSLAAMALVLRDLEACDHPILLSSATPSPLLLGELENLLGTSAGKITAKYRDSGAPGDLVVGELDVHLHLVPTPSKGRASYYQAGASIPDGVAEGWLNLESFLRNNLPRGERGMIITEKVSHAIEAAEAIRSTHGFTPLLKVSLVPPHLGNGDDRLLVGSASITQGVDYPNVTYGVIARATWENALQGKGRIARRTRRGELHIIAPSNSNTEPVAQEHEGRNLDYDQQEDLLRKLFPSQDPLLSAELRRARAEQVRRLRRDAAYKLSEIKHDTLQRSRTALSKHHSLTDSARSLRIITQPPESMAGLVTFRSTGLKIKALLGGAEIEADLGTLQRNFYLRIDGEGNIVAEHLGRGELMLTCSWAVDRALARLAGVKPPFIVPLDTLVEKADCRLTDGEGGVTKVPRDPTQLVLVMKTPGDFGEYLVTQGRALRLPGDLVAIYL